MNRFKIGIVTLIYIVQVFILSITNIYAEDIEQEKLQVLFISSYDSSFISFDDQVEGIRAGIGNNATIRIEYMDLKVFENKKNEEDFYKLLKKSLEIYNINAVIAGDDEATEFCIKYRNDLFEGIPISFLAVQDYSIRERALEYEQVSGVSEMESIRENIEFIKKFHPNVDTITFIDSYAIELYKKITSQYPEFRFNWIVTNDIPMNEVKRMLSELDRNDALIQLYVRSFSDNNTLSKDEINKLIVDSCKNVPIYNVLEYDIGQGSIGGKVINHFNQGKKAGEIAIGLLNGEDKNNLYIKDDSANKYIFDYKALMNFGIRTSNLPEDAIILNDPFEVFTEYKSIVIGVIMVFLGLSSLVIALLVYINYRRKYVKEMLIARKKAEEANMLKTHFISNISHELKTPINVIMSAVQLFKIKESSEDIYNGYSNNLNMIDNNCNRLLRLLNNIIDVQKAELDEIKLELTSRNIVELIEDLIISVVPYAETKNLNLVFDTDEEDILMEVDADKIERIILNLLSNAIKFSKENGEIRVNLKFEDKFYIIVEDDGVGIDQNDINNIFEKFTQVDNSLFRKNEGSGIGLSIVKSFVELHHGKIFVESTLDVGTRFTVELPMNIADEENKRNSRKDNGINNIRVELSDIYL